jgi:hypothetical protein
MGLSYLSPKLPCPRNFQRGQLKARKSTGLNRRHHFLSQRRMGGTGTCHISGLVSKAPELSWEGMSEIAWMHKP